MDELDDLYPQVREYIRDHAKETFNVEEVAEDMEVDIRRVQALVELGYLDRDVSGKSGVDEEKKKREELVRKLQGSFNNSASIGAKGSGESSPKMYGQQRYGTGKKERH